jgi:hypothetical protein
VTPSRFTQKRTDNPQIIKKARSGKIRERKCKSENKISKTETHQIEILITRRPLSANLFIEKTLQLKNCFRPPAKNFTFSLPLFVLRWSSSGPDWNVQGTHGMHPFPAIPNKKNWTVSGPFRAVFFWSCFPQPGGLAGPGHRQAARPGKALGFPMALSDTG